ncbi:MAG: GAF domain-containing protein [Ectothiorhodospiraceae bacterium]
MQFSERYYDGFERKWREPLEAVAAESGIESLLVMRSTPTHMVAVVSAGPGREVYHPGDAGPKSVNPGCHKLYCEQVVNDAQPLHVPDATSDPEWQGNEDLVNFGLGVYLGYPIQAPDGEVLGTICALNDTAFDFDAGDPSLRRSLEGLKGAIEADIHQAAA